MSTKMSTNTEPKTAAITCPHPPVIKKEGIQDAPDAIIRKATPKLAPELIPSIYGSAKGFLNSVCINKPAIANEDPANIAVSALGSRNCNIISEYSFAF